MIICSNSTKQLQTAGLTALSASNLVNKHSFYESHCPAVPQQKLLCSPWLGARQASIPVCLLLPRCVFRRHRHACQCPQVWNNKWSMVYDFNKNADRSLSMYIYIYIYTHTYIVYVFLSLSLYIYIYVYIYVCNCMYIYIYIYYRCAYIYIYICNTIYRYHSILHVLTVPYITAFIIRSITGLPGCLQRPCPFPHCGPHTCVTHSRSGKDKGGPGKCGFLNNILFAWIMYYSYTHAINFITQIQIRIWT